MPTKPVLFAELKDRLFRHGFHRLATTGSHTVFKHLPSEALVVLPSYADETPVSRNHLVAIDRIYKDYGLYDIKVFIDYDLTEELWIQQELIPRLDTAGIRAWVDYRDRKPGTLKLHEIEDALRESDKILLILTRRYLVRDEWQQILSVLKDPSQPVLLIVRESCPIPPTLQGMPTLNFVDPEDLEIEWIRLLKILKDPLLWDGGTWR